MTALRLHIFGIPLYRWGLLGGVVVILLALSIVIRDRLDIDWSLVSLREFVDGLDLWGPLAFIGILSFRFIFLIPTGLLLLTAGIVFGPVYGTLYAGLGMTGSGLVKYCFTRLIGKDAILRQLPPGVQRWVLNISTKKMSVWALGGVCAYPFIPKHIFQFAALLSGMAFAAYLLATMAGGFIRAALFSLIGQAVYTGTGLLLTSSLLLLAFAIPLCITPWRRWMLAPLARPSLHPQPETVS